MGHGYVNYASVTAVGVLFPILALLAWALRLRIWLKHSHKTEVDDILIIPAVLVVVAGGIGLVVGGQLKFVGGDANVKLEYLPYENSQQRGNELYEVWYFLGNVISIGFTRLAILFFFRRILGVRSWRTAFDVSNWIIIVVVTLWMIAMTFTQIFLCGTHISDEWSSLTPGNKQCADTFAALSASAVLSWVMDLAILIEPIVVVSRLSLKRERKIQICLMFCLAALATGASLAKMIVALAIFTIDPTSPPKEVLGVSLEDNLRLVSILVFWSYIEIGVGALVACLLPCQRYFSRLKLGLITHLPWTILSVRQDPDDTVSSQVKSSKDWGTYGTSEVSTSVATEEGISPVSIGMKEAEKIRISHC